MVQSNKTKKRSNQKLRRHINWIGNMKGGMTPEEMQAMLAKSGARRVSTKSDIKTCVLENPELIMKKFKPELLSKIKKIGIDKILETEWLRNNYGVIFLSSQQEKDYQDLESIKTKIQAEITPSIDAAVKCRGNEILQTFKQCLELKQGEHGASMCNNYLEAKRLEAEEKGNVILADALSIKNVDNFLKLPDEQQKTVIDALSASSLKNQILSNFGPFAQDWFDNAQSIIGSSKCLAQLSAPWTCYVDIATNALGEGIKFLNKNALLSTGGKSKKRKSKKRKTKKRKS